MSPELRTRPSQHQQAEPLPRSRHCCELSPTPYPLFTKILSVNNAQVGNEFSSVEALWSQFENVMAKDPEEGNPKVEEEQGEGQDDGDQTAHEATEVS